MRVQRHAIDTTACRTGRKMPPLSSAAPLLQHGSTRQGSDQPQRHHLQQLHGERVQQSACLVGWKDCRMWSKTGDVCTAGMWSSDVVISTAHEGAIHDVTDSRPDDFGTSARAGFSYGVSVQTDGTWCLECVRLRSVHKQLAPTSAGASAVLRSLFSHNPHLYFN